MFRYWLLGFLAASSAMALTGGETVRDPALVTLFRDERPVGLGVWVGRHHILTVSSLCPPHRGHELRIHRGTRWEGSPAVLEAVVQADVFGPLFHPGADTPLESPMILRSEQPGPTIALLPREEEVPGHRTHLTMVGLGRNGVQTWALAGSGAWGGWAQGTEPDGRFRFVVKEGEQSLQAWDRGGPLWDDRVVVGVLGQRQNAKAVYYWLGQPELLRWVRSTVARATTPPSPPEPIPMRRRRKPTGVPLSKPPVPHPGDGSIRILP